MVDEYSLRFIFLACVCDFLQEESQLTHLVYTYFLKFLPPHYKQGGPVDLVLQEFSDNVIRYALNYCDPLCNIIVAPILH